MNLGGASFKRFKYTERKSQVGSSTGTMDNWAEENSPVENSAVENSPADANNMVEEYDFVRGIIDAG